MVISPRKYTEASPLYRHMAGVGGKCRLPVTKKNWVGVKNRKKNSCVLSAEQNVEIDSEKWISVFILCARASKAPIKLPAPIPLHC